MTNNDILGCLRIQFSYNTNYLTQSFVESRYFSEILKRQSKYVRNSSSTMVIEQYWAWFNQSIGEGVHGETYRIAGIQLEEWKKRGHRHGISQNLTKERGNNVLLLFFLKMLLSWPRRKGVGKWNNILWKDRRFQDEEGHWIRGKWVFKSNTKTKMRVWGQNFKHWDHKCWWCVLLTIHLWDTQSWHMTFMSLCTNNTRDRTNPK